MSYAASGQLTGDAKNGTSFVSVYDDAGRLIEAKADGATLATYSYDAFEQRVAKTTTAAAPGGASSVHFIHDQFGRLIAEHDGASGAPLREYVWLGLMPVAFVDHSSGSAVTYYIHVDQVMTPQKLTDGSGAVVWDRVQDPFGVEVSATGSLTQTLRFPGQYADIETNLHQNWNRDYDPSLGRYVQSDPIGLIGGINTYAYVEGNPLTGVDPMGLKMGLAERLSNLIKNLPPARSQICNRSSSPIIVWDGKGTPVPLSPGQCTPFFQDAGDFAYQDGWWTKCSGALMACVAHDQHESLCRAGHLIPPVQPDDSIAPWIANETGMPTGDRPNPE